MRAIISDPHNVVGMSLSDLRDPAGPRDGQVSVAVSHVGLNFTETRHPELWPTGTVLGFEAAGVVLSASPGGEGPGVGARVVAYGSGAWSETAVFEVGSVAVLPDGVSAAVAAALPMAGLTALRTLRASGSLLGRRVLITGASGNVGRAAVQLARAAGASVIASSRADSAATLRNLGAQEFVRAPDEIVGEVDVVIDTVGGGQLVDAWNRLAPGGHLHSVGWASAESAEFLTGSTFRPGEARTLHSFGDSSAPASDLSALLSMIIGGVLDAAPARSVSWAQLATVIEGVRAGNLVGKTVLELD
jgi:NADPH:quinone reductase